MLRKNGPSVIEVIASPAGFRMHSKLLWRINACNVRKCYTPAATATPRGSVHEKKYPFEKEDMFAESASSC